jgi:hypothetical protein
LVKEREKNNSLKEKLIKIKRESQNTNSEEVYKMIINLKVQVEEAMRIDEA